jgi:hypothetical protein
MQPTSSLAKQPAAPTLLPAKSLAQSLPDDNLRLLAEFIGSN